MNKYNLMLVIIWILILSICKNRIIKKFNNFFNFSREDKPADDNNNLLENIQLEFNNIKLILNTEILSIKDKLSTITINKTSFNPIKTDLIDEFKEDNWLLNMNKVLLKTYKILKQFIYNILNKIKSYLYKIEIG